jgi:hypothetical protein
MRAAAWNVSNSICKPSSECGSAALLRPRHPALFKELAYQASKWMAHLLLRWSNYWGDIAECVHTGETMSEIKRRRK